MHMEHRGGPVVRWWPRNWRFQVRNPIPLKIRRVLGLLHAKSYVGGQTSSRWCGAIIWCATKTGFILDMFCVYRLLFLFCFTISQLSGNEISSYDNPRGLLPDMDNALHLLARAKISVTKYMTLIKTINPYRPVDCEEVLYTGYNKSGIYTIWPRNRVTEDKPLDVFCDMDTDGGGWTVLQRRGDFKRPIDYFNKDWESYKKGFGDIDKEFWLGNDNIFALTNQRAYSARFDLESIKGEKRYALYDSFWIEDEYRKYTLHIQDYSGDAGDSMSEQHNNMNFSTKDQDNDMHDEKNCGFNYKAGWWFNHCYSSQLNGLHRRGLHERRAGGVHWFSFSTFTESLATTEIKIRPKLFMEANKL
ncbi:Techylectin-5A [Araneus ventricosus]|uniref:Techylectin-5A n=1 Tax=Araneus ventricosus TaxID=182803 RepID=A0A4Y2KKZ3_ARAVE|nr:Techylectin-5A [Araneus ventricosus]